MTENECEGEGSYSYSGGHSGDTLSSSVARMKSKRVTNKASTLEIVRLRVKTPSVRSSHSRKGVMSVDEIVWEIHGRSSDSF
jgi:hypothetical protein